MRRRMAHGRYVCQLADDAAGNLTTDGTTTSTYDTLNRLLTTTAGSTTRSYRYNGDGVLVQQTANGVVTTFTQDLAAPLSQILQTTQGGATTNYLYGLERLASVSGTMRTWYTGDALGSVRRTLSDTGATGGTFAYDPWGTPTSSVTPNTFGFTGEWHDASIGLVNLRACWYQPRQGRLLSLDP